MRASLAIDVVVAALLVRIAWQDSRQFRIPNHLVLALVLVCPPAFLIEGHASLIIPHGLFALAALTVLFAGFAAGICGGGDAKFLATALLWIGPEGTFVFTLLLLPPTVIYAAGARLGLLPARRDGRGFRIPLGPCITIAWLGVNGLNRLI